MQFDRQAWVQRSRVGAKGAAFLGIMISSFIGCTLASPTVPMGPNGGGAGSSGGAGGNSGAGGAQACSSDSDCQDVDGGACRSLICDKGKCAEMQTPEGQPCGPGPTCSAGNLVPGAVCDGSGTCMPQSKESCGLYACDPVAKACKNTCLQDQDCATGAYCAGGLCVESALKGSSCNDSTECVPNLDCVDGVCCGGPCAGDCLTCNLTGGTPGTCSSLPDGLACGNNGGQACLSGSCVSAAWGGIGWPCNGDNECLNGNCFNSRCRLKPGQDCTSVAATPYKCQTNLCKDGVCEECAQDTDCPGVSGGSGGKCASSVCYFPAGAPCAVALDCVSQVCGNGGVCQ